MDKKWSNTVNLGSVEHPRGIYPARVDEKGRAEAARRLPQIFDGDWRHKSFRDELRRAHRPYLSYPRLEAGGKRLWIAPARRPTNGEDLLFTANDLGGDADVDPQGGCWSRADCGRQ